MSDGARHRSRAIGIIGFALLVAGLGWAIIDRLLRRYRPLTWGGPNIGGGALLLAWLATAGGVALLIVALVLYRHGSRTPTRPRSSGWVAAACAVALAEFFALLVVRSPSATSAINGQIGVTVSDAGTAVLVLEICRGSTTDVTISGPNRGDVPNEVRAHFAAASPAVSTVLLDIAHPPPGWIAQTGLPGLATNDLQIASGRGQQSVVREVSFSPADLATLTPGTVLYSTGSSASSTTSRENFRAAVCT